MGIRSGAKMPPKRQTVGQIYNTLLALLNKITFSVMDS